MHNALFFGDNLKVMRERIADESVDLIYLDPPFNSARTYNLLFKQVKGDNSPAQIMAFEDTWTYSNALYEDFRQDPANVRLLDLVESLHRILGNSEMMAYVLMMAPRLLELHRKLKPTGSLYLHCDPVASHYLKIVLDVVFNPANFRNEITWKRSDGHNDAKRQFGRVSDRLLVYARTDSAPFNRQHAGFQDQTLRDWYQFLEFPDGTVRRLTKEERETQVIPTDARRFNADNMTSPNPRPNLMFVYKGYPHPAKGWRYSVETMQDLDAKGLLLFPADPQGRIMRKRYLDEQAGSVVGDVWTDLSHLRGASKEGRGYPTQKPLALLQRIIAASSNEGDVVLDPFCGCGTAVVAAERMGRRWLGIDITWLAVAEVISRLSTETEAKRDVDYSVVGQPADTLAAQKFFEDTASQNHKPFEMWAVSLVEGQPIEKKGSDKGVDGRIPLFDHEGKLCWAVIQVKGGHLSPSLFRDFAHVIEREKALFGIFISLEEPTKPMLAAADDGGFVEGFGTRRIPRLQILTIKDLLEGKRRFDFPDGYRPQRYEGVGKKGHVQFGLDL